VTFSIFDSERILPKLHESTHQRKSLCKLSYLLHDHKGGRKGGSLSRGHVPLTKSLRVHPCVPICGSDYVINSHLKDIPAELAIIVKTRKEPQIGIVSEGREGEVQAAKHDWSG
jgi:hypothetical protein